MLLPILILILGLIIDDDSMGLLITVQLGARPPQREDGGRVAARPRCHDLLFLMT